MVLSVQRTHCSLGIRGIRGVRVGQRITARHRTSTQGATGWGYMAEPSSETVAIARHMMGTTDMDMGTGGTNIVAGTDKAQTAHTLKAR